MHSALSNVWDVKATEVRPCTWGYEVQGEAISICVGLGVIETEHKVQVGRRRAEPREATVPRNP